jgi:hypothetical protein
MAKRIAASVAGLLLLGTVLGLGAVAVSNPVDGRMVALFGIVAAFATQPGFSLLMYSVVAPQRAALNKALEKLMTIPEIEGRIAEAKSVEERIRLLEEQRAKLAEAAMAEARRAAITTRRDMLLAEALRVRDELTGTLRELERLDLVEGAGPVADEIRRLNERITASRPSGDEYTFRVGSREVRIPREILAGFWPANLGLLLLDQGGRAIQVIRRR